MSQDTKQGVLITQEDIDEALAAFRPPEAGEDDASPLFLNESDIVEDGVQTDSEYFGLLSQDDIEALLHGDLEGGGSGPQDAQNEIDSLMDSAVLEKDTPHATAEAVGQGNAQDDVEALIREAESDSGENVKDDSLIAQDDIDKLLMSALDDVGEEEDVDTAVPESGELVGQDDIDQLLAGVSDEAEAPIETAAPESGEVVSQDDINRLLAGASDEDEADDGGDLETPEPEPEGAPESLISQADLDQLIAGEERGAEGMEPLDHGPKDSSEHISQDDINRLLKESFEEEAPLPDETPAGEDEGEDLTEPEAEPVILAAEEEAPPAPSPGKATAPAKAPRGKTVAIPKKMLVWGAAAAVVFICLSVVMMTRGSRQPAPQPQSQPEVLTFSIPSADDQVADAAGNSEKSIHFPGFVVLVPNDRTAAAYVSADLTLEVSDVATVAVIKENEPFVRDIIYGAISDELKTQDISAIDEAGLVLAIRKALDRIITRGAIDRIAFDSLSLV